MQGLLKKSNPLNAEIRREFAENRKALLVKLLLCGTLRHLCGALR
jgi:hypothetical protein